ncbi:hypothetical protein Thermus77923_22260 [Thermus oshimai]
MPVPFSVSLSVSPQPLRAPVRWATRPEEVPPWELGRSWSVFSPDYPEALRKLELLRGAGEAFQRALEEAEKALPPPPPSWGYPRLVLAEPPVGRYPAALWHKADWEVGKPMRPLAGFRRLRRALTEDFRLGAPELPRTRKALLEVVPRIGLLDPFRQGGAGSVGEEGLLPNLESVRKAVGVVSFGSVPLREDLRTWVQAILAVGFWDLAAEGARARVKLEDFARALPEAFGLREERWRWEQEMLNRPFPGVPEGAEVLYSVPLITPEELLLREVHHLALKGTKNGVLSPALIRKRLWEWGLKGLHMPGPFRFAAAPQEGVKVGPLPALASSFHLALLQLAETLGEGRALVCEWCGATFTAQRPGRARFCSDACRLQAHRSRKGRLQISLPKAD